MLLDQHISLSRLLESRITLFRHVIIEQNTICNLLRHKNFVRHKYHACLITTLE